MLRINPIVKVKSYDLKGVQARTPEFFVSRPVIKPNLKTDVFQRQEKRESFSEVSFWGNKVQNRYVSGEIIANNIEKVLKGFVGGVSSEQFKSEYKKLNEKNIIPTINAYNKISPEETLIAAICKERANSYKSRMDAVSGITDMLVNLGNKAGVQTQHYKEHFDKELKSQYETILPVKVNQLDKISGALVQAIENKNSLTEYERNSIKNADIKDTQSYTTNILNNSVKNARKSMKEQANYDGWCAKFGEQIRKIWNSENQKELVYEDIKIFDNQVKELDKLVGTKDYNKKFKEIFDVEYDPELIATYKQKEEKFVAAAICSGVENNFNKSVPDLLKNKPLTDKYNYVTNIMGAAIPVLEETKEQIYERNLNSFAEFVGKGNKEEGKKQIEKTMKEYRIKSNSSLEDKYAVMQRIAQKYSRRLHQNTQKATGKKDLAEMKREYDNSYYAAFGVKNDIAKRVADYRNSQMWSELLVQDTILGAASIPIWLFTAGTGVIPTLKIAAMHSGAAAAVYGSDRLSSKQGMTASDIKEILKYTAVDGATAIANQFAYKGIEAITSPIAKMSGKTAAKLTEFALSTVADVAIDSSFEYIATGKITLQGVVYSVAFSAGGYIIDLKVDDAQRKTL